MEPARRSLPRERSVPRFNLSRRDGIPLGGRSWGRGGWSGRGSSRGRRRRCERWRAIDGRLREHVEDPAHRLRVSAAAGVRAGAGGLRPGGGPGRPRPRGACGDQLDRGARARRGGGRGEGASDQLPAAAQAAGRHHGGAAVQHLRAADRPGGGRAARCARCGACARLADRALGADAGLAASRGRGWCAPSTTPPRASTSGG